MGSTEPLPLVYFCLTAKVVLVGEGVSPTFSDSIAIIVGTRSVGLVIPALLSLPRAFTFNMLHFFINNRTGMNRQRNSFSAFGECVCVRVNVFLLLRALG